PSSLRLRAHPVHQRMRLPDLGVFQAFLDERARVEHGQVTPRLKILRGVLFDVFHFAQPITVAERLSQVVPRGLQPGHTEGGLRASRNVLGLVNFAVAGCYPELANVHAQAIDDTDRIIPRPPGLFNRQPLTPCLAPAKFEIRGDASGNPPRFQILIARKIDGPTATPDLISPGFRHYGRYLGVGTKPQPLDGRDGGIKGGPADGEREMRRYVEDRHRVGAGGRVYSYPEERKARDREAHHGRNRGQSPQQPDLLSLARQPDQIYRPDHDHERQHQHEQAADGDADAVHHGEFPVDVHNVVIRPPGLARPLPPLFDEAPNKRRDHFFPGLVGHPPPP